MENQKSKLEIYVEVLKTFSIIIKNKNTFNTLDISKKSEIPHDEVRLCFSYPWDIPTLEEKVSYEFGIVRLRDQKFIKCSPKEKDFIKRLELENDFIGVIRFQVK